MISTTWKNFDTDSEFYTQSTFERKVGDTFESMHFEKGKNIPNYIWTNKFVILVKINTRMINDVSFIKVPRNPEDA